MFLSGLAVSAFMALNRLPDQQVPRAAAGSTEHIPPAERAVRLPEETPAPVPSTPGLSTLAPSAPVELAAVSAGDAHSAPAQPQSAGEPGLYDGQTIAWWREAIRNLDPNDPHAAEAVPGLMALAADQQVSWFTRRDAALTLGRIGQPAAAAVPLLIRLLDEAPAQAGAPADWACRALALLGAEAAPAARPLTRLLRNPQREAGTRMAAIDALARIGAGQSQVLPTLIATLTVQPGPASGLSPSEAITFRELAAQGLGLIGGQASAAVPALLRATRDRHSSVRREAVLALAAIGPEAQIAVPGLLERLVIDDDESVQDTAEQALAAIASDEVQGALRQLLADEEAEIRWRSARTLRELGPPARASGPALLRCLGDAEPRVRLEAGKACLTVGVHSRQAAETLVELLSSNRRQIRISAARHLAAFPAIAAELQPRLQQLAAPESLRTARQCARLVLDAIDRAATINGS